VKSFDTNGLLTLHEQTDWYHMIRLTSKLQMRSRNDLNHMPSTSRPCAASDRDVSPLSDC
jgi:hypothetical protein